MAVSARSFRFVFLGGLFAATSVAAGAFGAHALKSILDPSMLAVYETAARYQMYHALGLFVVAWLLIALVGYMWGLESAKLSG